MCGGRIDIAFILRAFSEGADGVLICSCWPGECHYVPEGNYNAASMMNLTKKLLGHIGVDSERLHLQWVTASEGIQFAETVTTFTNRVKELGPLGSKEGLEPGEVKSRLEGLQKLVPYIKIAQREKLLRHLDDVEKYSELYSTEEIEQMFEEVPAYYIDPEKCHACGTCRRRCPVEAIDGDKNIIHIIDQDKCIKCGTCLAVCPPRFGAVQKLVGESVPPPIPEEKRKIQRKAKASA
jgi:coenzyme F420-reducing hydrogenase delta subunit/ferredoxin